MPQFADGPDRFHHACVLGGVGLVAKKSRWRKGSIDNRGQFMLIDPLPNSVVAGLRFDLTAEDILEFCAN